MELELNRPDGEMDTIMPGQSAANLQTLFREPDQSNARARAGDFGGALLSPLHLGKLERWMIDSPTGPNRIKGGVRPGMVVVHKTGTSGRGHSNDIGVIRPMTAPPIFIAIYLEAPEATGDQRDAVIAEATRLTLSALGHA